MRSVVKLKQKGRGGAKESKVFIVIALRSPTAPVAAAAGPNVERTAAVLEVQAQPAHKPEATFRENNKKEAVDPPLRSFKERLQRGEGEWSIVTFTLIQSILHFLNGMSSSIFW